LIKGEVVAMPVRPLDEIIWDGQALVVILATDDGPLTCRVPRETIHAMRIYSDIIGREIQLERRNIVERLAPFLIAKVSRAVAGETSELLPSDVYD
jgi:hypothetical protein